MWGAALNFVIPLQLNVTSGSVSGRVDGSTVQCTYEATPPDTNTRAADYAVAVINGTDNTGKHHPCLPFWPFMSSCANKTLNCLPFAVNRALGAPFILFNTSILNLSNVTNSSPGVVPHQQSLLHGK